MLRARWHRRRWASIAGVILLALAGLDTLVWAVACRRLDGGAREALTAAGWVLESQPTRWGGWPWAAEITLGDATLHTGPDIVPPLRWTVPHLALRLTPWSPTQVVASAGGRQSLAIGAAAPVPFSAAALTADLDLTTRTPPRLTATGMAVEAPFGPVRAGTATLILPPDGWSATLADVTIPGRDGRPVTPPIDGLQIDGRLEPPIPAQPTARESAQAWRGRNGRLTVSVPTLRWGALAATGRFTVTLDPALQPVVAGSLTASGLPAALAQLAETGAITAAGSTAAQAMVLILAAPFGNGAVPLPVAVQDGIVTVARFPLLRLSPLQWD